MNNLDNNKQDSRIKDLTLSAILIALATVGSLFSVPIFTSKAAPIQHMVNVISGTKLSVKHSVGIAFGASLLRNIMGLGTPLAFPGSMIGAFLGAMLFKKYKNILATIIGELIGTGFIGGLAAFLMGKWILGLDNIGAFTFVMPFFLSSLVGVCTAFVILKSFEKLQILKLESR